MELLRIVAMLMVVALHVSTGGFGYINTHNVQQAPFAWYGTTLTLMGSIGCVDIFVLITGWFGTRFKWSGAFRLVAQTAFVALAMYPVVWLIGSPLPHSFAEGAKALWTYWFVQSYLLLYVISPLLNAFVEQSDERRLSRLLVAYYVCCLPLSYINSDIARGYSAFSFIGLYLLGRYLRLYGAARLRRVRSRWLALTWTALVLLMTTAVWGMARWGNQTLTHQLIHLLTAYSQPLVILCSSLLLLLASRLHFSSRCVNFLAAGSFTVYLTHQQLYIRPAFFQLVKDVAAAIPSPVLCSLALLGWVVAVYVGSAALDSVRRLMFSWVESRNWKKMPQTLGIRLSRFLHP